MMLLPKTYFLALILIATSASGQGCFDGKAYKELANGKDSLGRTERQYYEAMRGCDMPNFSSLSLQGDSISSDNLKGKVVVMNFWFVKCSSCIVEIPYLNELADSFKQKDVVFIAMCRDSTNKISKPMADYFHYTHVTSAREISKQFNIKLFPTTIIFDRAGRVVSYDAGQYTDSQNMTNKVTSRIRQIKAILNADK